MRLLNRIDFRKLRAGLIVRGVCLAGGIALSVVQPSHGQCLEPDTNAAWVRVARKWESETGLHWSNDSLRQQLLAAKREDQAVRVNFGARASDTTYLRTMAHGDSSRAVWLADVIHKFGLPTKSLVGARGADAAMLIAQHNAWLLPQVLDLARQLPVGEESPGFIALMEDRARVQRGEKQLYGSQFKMMPDGSLRFEPAEDVQHLAARRASAGLPPLVPDYVCMLEQTGARVDRSSLPPIPE